MNKQVITIGPDGSIAGLQHKAGKGLDLRQFGKAEIERVSLIEWDAEQQGWYVLFLATHTVIDGSKLTYSMWDALLEGTEIEGARGDAGETTQPVLFQEYDDGVKAEIAYLNALRLAGHM
jgi:hypothetical protein